MLPPPCALDSEGILLAAAMERQEAADMLVASLGAVDFYSGPNRCVYEAIAAIQGAGAIPDVIAVKGYLERTGKLEMVDPVYLERAFTLQPYCRDLRQHVALVRSSAKLRRLISTCQEIAAEAYTATDADAFVDRAEQEIYEIAADKQGKDHIHTLKESIQSLFRDLQKDQEARKAGKSAQPTTGLAELDALIGGLHRGSLMIIGARPSMGKTAFMLTLARAVASADSEPRLASHVISLETRHTRLAMRLVCSDARFDASRIMRGDVGDDDWGTLTAAASRAARLPLTIDDRPGLNLAQVRASIRRAQAMHRKTDADGNVLQQLGAVFVDYLQLAKAAQRNGNREQEVGALAYGLLEMAKEFDVPIVALSQLSRAVESRQDKRPTISDLRESGNIEQAADVILGLYRDEYYNTKSDAKGVAEVIVLKSKDTATGAIRVAFNGPWMRFDDLEAQ